VTRNCKSLLPFVVDSTDDLAFELEFRTGRTMVQAGRGYFQFNVGVQTKWGRALDEDSAGANISDNSECLMDLLVDTKPANGGRRRVELIPGSFSPPIRGWRWISSTDREGLPLALFPRVFSLTHGIAGG
jgi:hypothetical protein